LHREVVDDISDVGLRRLSDSSGIPLLKLKVDSPELIDNFFAQDELTPRCVPGACAPASGAISSSRSFPVPAKDSLQPASQGPPDVEH